MADPTPSAGGPHPDLPSRPWRAWLIVWGIALAHALAIWGYTGLFWGDHGRWLYEVSRFAAGEVPYRDFAWSSPPFALWIVGGAARVVGTSVGAISTIMLALYLAIVALFLHHLRRLMPDLILPIALPSLFFAMSYASRSGAPLPLGTASPAGPVGFLFLLGATGSFIHAADRRTLAGAAMAGVLVGLTVLSKRDFWPAGAYILATGTALLARRSAAGSVLLAPFAAAGLTVLVGLTVSIASAGPGPVVYMLSASEDLMRGTAGIFPSLERLTVEAAATAALVLTAVTSLWLCLAISDRTAGRWAGGLGLVFLTAAAIHLGMSVSVGRDLMANGPEPLPSVSQETIWVGLQSGRALVPAAFAFFDERLKVHLFPVLLAPILLGVLIYRWRLWSDRPLANRVALLLGLCVVARLPRGFRGADWYNVLLELPSYALYLQLVCGGATAKAARAVRAALTVIIVLGLYAYLSMNRGVFTISGRFPLTRTPSGAVRWSPFEARAYRRADSLVALVDSSGRRRLQAFGASGGWNYFLGRLAPGPASGGLSTGPWPVDSTIEWIREAEPPAMLLDNRFALRPSPSPIASPLRWEPTPVPNVYARLDRGPFEKLVAGCPVIGLIPGDSVPPAIVVYDCAALDGWRAPVTRRGSSR